MKKKLKIITTIIIVATVVGIGGWLVLRGGGADKNRGVFRGPVHEVKRGDLLISITEGGAINAVREVSVHSEVSGQRRIISVVGEGSMVKKGDLLVELDSSEILEKLEQEKILYESEVSAYEQTKESVKIRISQNLTNLREAQLKVKFAGIELEKYRDGDGPMNTRTAEAAITVAEADLELSKDKLAWTEKLQKKGYATRSELEADRLSVKRKEIGLDTAQEKLRLLKKYTTPQMLTKLESEVIKTKEELERVKLRGSSELSSERSDLKAKEVKKNLRASKLKRRQGEIKKAKILAPQDGLVVYPEPHWRRSSEIEVGATVYERQELIKLPDTSQMKVVVKIHESSMNLVKLGQIAFISLEALSDRRYKGKVTKVAIMPDTQSRWLNPDLKVYSTEVLIEDELPAGVKPGLSAKVEIIVTKLEDALRVPIQCVTTKDGKQVCYVREGGEVKAHRVTVGMFNETDIQIAAGLNEGDAVLLNPPPASEADNLGIRVITSDEVTAADLKQAEDEEKRLEEDAARKKAADEEDLGIPKELLDKIPADKREAFKKRIKAMTPEQRKGMLELMKKGRRGGSRGRPEKGK